MFIISILLTCVNSTTWLKINRNDNANDLKFTLYPNPFVDDLDLSFTTYNNQELQLDIYSLTGVKTYSKTFKASQDIRFKLQDLPSGIYIVKILTPENKYTKTIIKRNSN